MESSSPITPQPSCDVSTELDVTTSLRACHCCGLIQKVPIVTADDILWCYRCKARIRIATWNEKSNQRTAAAAIAALVLFFPAITLPLIEIERLGHRQASNLLSGTWDMFTHGAWFVGTIVMLFSIVLPMAKILLLLELSLLGLLHRQHRASTYRMMEHVGKWGMMDVLLLAMMVMLVKLGDIVEVHLGPGIIAFALCVMMSMIASLSFDPHSIWNEP